MKIATAFTFLSLALCYASTAYADTFGTDPNTSFDIEFVTIGNPGNAADTTGAPNPAGSVPYEYRISKFEISEDMIDKANTMGSLGITKDTRGPNKPATSVNWFEAAKFVNWLNTSSGNTPAYKFVFGNFQLWDPNDAGYDPNNLYRNSQATYFLPSVDEWYKAAYYDFGSATYYDYPTGSDTAPTPVASGTAAGTAVYNGQAGPADITLAGGLSPYGTMGQGGNVWEWEETEFDLVNNSTSSNRGVRGGGWDINSNFLAASDRSSTFPTNENFIVGFRVASIGIAGDFDFNGEVNGLDFLLWQCDPSIGSLADWQTNYGTVATISATSAAVPEPTTSALALAALCLAMSRRRAF